MNVDIIQRLSLHFKKQIYFSSEFKHSKIEQSRTSRSVCELQRVADTAGSIRASRSDKSTLSSHLNPRLFSSEGAAAAAHLPPPPGAIHLKATPFNTSNPQLFARYILNVSLWLINNGKKKEKLLAH